MTARRVAAPALVLLALSPACGPATPPEPPNPVEGNIVAIEGDRLTLETVEEDQHAFRIGDPGVPVEHLHEHRRQRLPVLITWRREGDTLNATTIADA